MRRMRLGTSGRAGGKSLPMQPTLPPASSSLVPACVPTSSQTGAQRVFLLQGLTFTENENKAISLECWWHLFTKRSLLTQSKAERMKEVKEKDNHVPFACIFAKKTTGRKEHKGLTEPSRFASCKAQHESGGTFANSGLCYCSLKGAKCQT